MSSTQPLRIAAMVKQVPAMDRLELGPDNRLRREGLELEMNPYCRRAVAKGVELAQASGGSCTAFSLGPPSADDVLREAVAWGVDEALLITGAVFAGSDTLATARALSVAVHAERPLDLVLVGQNSVDGDTGQVGPQLAQLLDLPFVGPARELEVHDGILTARCEREGGWVEVQVTLPAVVSVAERLCDPCKVRPEGRAEVDAARIRVVTPRALGRGPWGERASRTAVGATRRTSTDRARIKLIAEPAELAAAAAAEIRMRTRDGGLFSGTGAGVVASPVIDGAEVVAVIHEPDRDAVTRQLLGRAAGLARELDAQVVLVSPVRVDGDLVWSWGADAVLVTAPAEVAEDVAATVAPWLRRTEPTVLLAPATMWGREVAARLAAQSDSGLIGDAGEIELAQGRLVGWKPAFHGELVAAVTATSTIQMATVRPGVLPVLSPRAGTAAAPRTAPLLCLRPVLRHRVDVVAHDVDDDPDALCTAGAVLGIGLGVAPDEYPLLEPLRELLDAQIGATRKVTDRGWQPHSRQIGVTGCSVAPRIYVALGTRGNFNHMAGVRNADFVIAINCDPDADVFDHADLGLVADWRQVVPLLVQELSLATSGPAGAGRLVTQECLG
jgi:electron transfer flavoprotein alpha subunit